MTVEMRYLLTYEPLSLIFIAICSLDLLLAVISIS